MAPYIVLGGPESTGSLVPACPVALVVVAAREALIQEISHLCLLEGPRVT